ncbi:MAG TPA: hypothetical protein VMF06_00855 [Candidatus Limnocylindria bacterium]|jgi:hypothetical protein|nr:hypothetical protein [Candidatus Limnocylindria bacterium]
MRRTRQALAIVGLAVLLVLGWCGYLALGGGHAQFADNSWQSNQIRIQRYLFPTRCPDAVLIGSSVTGRFLPEYFRETGLPEAANLGLDGSGPLLGSLLVQRRNDLPRVVVVESFLADKPWTANDSNLLANATGFSMQLAAALPVLQAENRPSSLLYSWIKRRKESTYATLGRPASPVGPRNPTPAMSESARRLTEALAELQQKGVKVVIARFPTGESRAGLLQDLPPDDPGLAMARSLKAPFLNVGKEVVADGWEPLYTDGLHLNADSARRVSAQLGKMVASAVK